MSRKRAMLLALATLAVILAGIAPFLSGEPRDDEPPPPPPSGDQVVPSPPRECSPAARARVARLEVGATLTSGWTIAAIHCVEEDDCTRIQVSSPPNALTLRVCTHAEGGPLPPVTRDGLDVFYDSPHPPEAEPPEGSVQPLLDAVAASLGAGG